MCKDNRWDRGGKYTWYRMPVALVYELYIVVNLVYYY